MILSKNFFLSITLFITTGANTIVISQEQLQTKSHLKENVIYGMYSGFALLMDVYHPDKPNGYGIIFIAGSGWSGPLAYSATPLKNNSQVEMYCKPLIDAGYTVFAVNHRSSPRFHYPGAVEDVQRAVRYIRYNAGVFGIDSEKIGAAGGSSGGHLVSLLGVLDGKGNPDDPDPVSHKSAKVQCVVARAAPTDLINGIPDAGDSTWYFAVSAFMGWHINDSSSAIVYKTYKEASPVSHVSQDDPPFLLIDGDADKVVNIRNSELMEQALKKEGVKVKLLRIKNGGHGSDFPGAKYPPDYLREIVLWFNQYFKLN
ncbi:prolyl oligopeptidase family serine peptidase [Flavitalea sp.]|nr:alpha/beta hydrolase [Flavitalea sp.]